MGKPCHTPGLPGGQPGLQGTPGCIENNGLEDAVKLPCWPAGHAWLPARPARPARTSHVPHVPRVRRVPQARGGLPLAQCLSVMKALDCWPGAVRHSSEERHSRDVRHSCRWPSAPQVPQGGIHGQGSTGILCAPGPSQGVTKVTEFRLGQVCRYARAPGPSLGRGCWPTVLRTGTQCGRAVSDSSFIKVPREPCRCSDLS